MCAITYIYTHIYIYIYTYVYICVCVCVVYVYVCMCTYMCAFTYICIHILCVHIYVLNIPIFCAIWLRKCDFLTEKLGIKFIPDPDWPDPDPKWFIPDPTPDPAKSSGSDRIRIHNTEPYETVPYLRKKQKITASLQCILGKYLRYTKTYCDVIFGHILNILYLYLAKYSLKLCESEHFIAHNANFYKRHLTCTLQYIFKHMKRRSRTLATRNHNQLYIFLAG